MKRRLTAENFVILAGLAFLVMAWVWGMPR